MKKIGLLSLFACILFFACSDSDLPDVNGMWQLKTIQDESGNTQVVDTVFYSFQRKKIFSHTLLKKNEINQEIAYVVYGYIDFPTEDKLLISLDEAYRFPYVLENLHWDNYDIEYDIFKLSSKEMILTRNHEIYTFKKF